MNRNGWTGHGNRNSRHSRRGIGFTLVELLITIAIIAILCAILLPALAKARGKGKAIRCVSQLKQIGSASISYSVDHNDWVPQADWRWNGDVSFNNGFVPQTYPYVAGTMMPKTGDIHPLYRCPSDTENYIVGSSRDGKPITNYAWNSQCGLFSGGSDQFKWSMRKFSKCRRPTEAVMAIDAKAYRTTATSNSSWFDFHNDEQPLLAMALRHNNADNHLAADGHVFNARLNWVLENLNASYQFGNNFESSQAKRYYSVWPF